MHWTLSVSPLLSAVHSICVTLTEKLLDAVVPDETAVKTTGADEARPTLMYTEVEEKVCWRFSMANLRTD